MSYFLEIYPNGERHEYRVNDRGWYHCESKPAYIYYHKNGNIRESRWIVNGNYHRIDGPAVIDYYENGTIENEIWCINNNFHRIDGPAVIEYDEKGNMTIQEYWWNGYNITVFVQNLFGDIPNELSKENYVLLKLSLPEECFQYDTRD